MSNLTEKVAAFLALRGKPHFPELQAVLEEIRDQVLNVQAALFEAVSGTSASSFAIGTGSFSIVIDGVDTKSFITGQRLSVAHDSTHYVVAMVDSWNAGTRTLAFTVASGDTKGTGTFATWSVSMVGDEGQQGPPGTDGISYTSNPNLAAIALLTPTNGSVLKGNGTTFVAGSAFDHTNALAILASMKFFG